MIICACRAARFDSRAVVRRCNVFTAAAGIVGCAFDRRVECCPAHAVPDWRQWSTIFVHVAVSAHDGRGCGVHIRAVFSDHSASGDPWSCAARVYWRGPKYLLRALEMCTRAASSENSAHLFTAVRLFTTPVITPASRVCTDVGWNIHCRREKCVRVACKVAACPSVVAADGRSFTTVLRYRSSRVHRPLGQRNRQICC